MSKALLILYKSSLSSKYFDKNRIGGVLTACQRIIKIHRELNVSYSLYNYCDFGVKLNFLYPFRLVIDVFFMLCKTKKVKYIYCVCDHNSLIRSIIYLFISKIIFLNKLYFLDIRGGGNYIRLEKKIKNYNSFLLYLTYKLADKIIIQTPNINCIPKEFATKLYFLPNTIHDHNKKFIIYKNYKFNRENKFKIIFSGRITEEKGIEKIFKLCNSPIAPKIKIGLAGPINLNAKNESILNKYCKKKIIIYHGVLDKDSLIEVLSEYNLFLFTSKHITEGMPNSLLDAVSVKLPILTKDIGFIKDLFKDEYFNFLKNSNDRYISKYIENIINNYPSYLLKAEKAFDYAIKNYSHKVYKKKLIQLYK
tara:strand:- start:1015 stop:2106 length:1092 start_codon:yes stop_codon:yes gene_type:complete